MFLANWNSQVGIFPVKMDHVVSRLQQISQRQYALHFEMGNRQVGGVQLFEIDDQVPAPIFPGDCKQGAEET